MMNKGELLTRITIWLALAGYAIGVSAYLLSRGRRSWDAVARAAWALGCASIIAHVAFAYHFYHNWSQASVYRETARQTAEVTGLDWGGGVFFNYALVIGWIMDAVYWRFRGLDAYRNRPPWLATPWQFFLFFIVFNATVVFKTGALRWIGLGLCLWLAFITYRTYRSYRSYRSYETTKT
ncbi:MAG TPA: hypothetical protein VI479_16130 [Blastocatellia bacterium]